MWGAWAVLMIVLLVSATLQFVRWWRCWRQRMQQRFDDEMCQRWGNDPIPRWHHDERTRARAMSDARAHKTRS
jgi:hypothetical protein